MPAAAQPSRSARVARRNEPALRALDPPTTRPRGTGTVRPGKSSPRRSQFAGWPGAAAAIVDGVAELRGEVRRPGVVGAGLQQEHPAAGVGQPGRHDAAGGAGPDDDDVPLLSHRRARAPRSRQPHAVGVVLVGPPPQHPALGDQLGQGGAGRLRGGRPQVRGTSA